jgi:hypothetical protein
LCDVTEEATAPHVHTNLPQINLSVTEINQPIAASGQICTTWPLLAKQITSYRPKILSTDQIFSGDFLAIHCPAFHASSEESIKVQARRFVEETFSYSWCGKGSRFPQATAYVNGITVSP